MPGKTNQPLRLLTEEDITDREDMIDGEDTSTAGLGGEDNCPDFEEIDVREDDQNDQAENIIINDDIQPRYNLRSRKVNLTSVGKEQLKNEKAFTPILKFKNYDTKDNYKLDYFKLNNRAHFRAHKRGLLHHHLNCKKERNCSECDFHRVTKGFVFIENNLQAYDEGHQNFRDTKIIKIAPKLTFENKTIYRHEIVCKSADISSFWIRMQLVNLYCCSLPELACLNN